MKKKEKLALTMGEIEEKFVEEAGQTSGLKKSNRTRLIVRLSVIAAVIALLMAVLFVPFYDIPPSVAKYSGSEYYDLIKKLNKATYRAPEYKNNFERLILTLTPKGIAPDADNFDGGYYSEPEYNGLPVSAADDVKEDANAEANTGADSYREVTDNQVFGVTEADRIKRSDRYVFYMYDNRIEAFELKNGDIELIGGYTPVEKDNNGFYRTTEMYLSSDCKTLTLIANAHFKSTSGVKIISLDVSDPTRIAKKGEVNMTGEYLSSRIKDGRLMVFSRVRVSYNPDYSDESTFIPQIDTGDGFTSIPADRIFYPEDINNEFYTTICEFDEQSLTLRDSIALLSYGNATYVSHDSIYFSAYSIIESDSGKSNKAVTDISRVSYGGERMEYRGTIRVDGTVKDQYSMDEYNDVLRVFTTVSETTKVPSGNYYRTESYTSASLYCIGIDDMKLITSVERFAPVGETVRSARFDKDKAYVCTSVMATDPVFIFDLSSLDNITYKDTGTIPGYSTSLINFGEGYLLGIGIGDEWGLKVEVYKESEDGVVSVAKYESDSVSYSAEYKSYFIDRDRKLVGIPIIDNGNEYGLCDGRERYRYLLLGFDSEELKTLLNVRLDGYHIMNKRAFCIDDTLYMFGETGCVTASLVDIIE